MNWSQWLEKQSKTLQEDPFRLKVSFENFKFFNSSYFEYFLARTFSAILVMVVHPIFIWVSSLPISDLTSASKSALIKPVFGFKLVFLARGSVGTFSIFNKLSWSLLIRAIVFLNVSLDKQRRNSFLWKMVNSMKNNHVTYSLEVHWTMKDVTFTLLNLPVQ